MRYLFVVVGLLALLLGWGLRAAHPNIQIIDPQVHETTGKRATLHATIVNTGVNGDRLLRVSTSHARKVTILNYLGQEVDSLMIPADSELVLRDEAPRIELVGLTQFLNAHDIVQLLFVFERTGKMRIRGRVEAGDGR